ncbi:MAG: Phosphoserine aminotransferase [bacterium]|nr:Phosphoserine aminotransferase [bacterium]
MGGNLMENRIHNFSAGPAILPVPVLKQAQKDLVALPSLGMSVMEISHRCKAADEIFETTERNLRELLQLPENYKVLFLQGGASLQFSMVPMNVLRGEGRSADYILTGSWGEKAIKEAKKEGTTRVVWTGKESNFVRVPTNEELELSADSTYVHFTSNETIQGVQFASEPESGGAPLVCDASSDILSRPLDVSRYGLIYAGAQKNIGPAGLTLVIIREDLVAKSAENLPTMLSYRVHVENKSLYNTPPVFAIYIMMLVTRWLLEEIGGLEKMGEINRRKAGLLYEVIDASGGFYRGHADPASRSLMNVTWRLPDENLEKQFVSEATKLGLDGLKGHRSVGGIRASIYNAMPLAGVQALAEFMKDFQRKLG